MAEETEIANLADFVEAHLVPQIKEVNGVTPEGKTEILLLPRGLQAISLKSLLNEYRTYPERAKGTVQASDTTSFIGLVNRFKDGDSVIFAQRGGQPSLLGVLNYNRANPNANADPSNQQPVPADMARFGDHKIYYPFPVSKAWRAWTSVDSRSLSQEDFADFLESHIADVAPALSMTPVDGEDEKDVSLRALLTTLGGGCASVAKLVDVSRNLKLRATSVVKNAINLASGEVQFSFENTHSDEYGTPVSIPQTFLIGIQVFEGGDSFRIPVRLRYRLNNARVTFILQLYRSDDVFDAAFDEACTAVATATGIPLYYGSPDVY